MKTRTRFLFECLLLAVSACGIADAEFTSYSYYDGKRYEFKITEGQQSQCPKWDPEKDANPPYSAAAALKQAKEFIATIPTSKETFWGFEDLALVDVSGGWAWRARYRLTRRGGSTGVWPTMDCLILMSGDRIAPIVTDDKR